MSRKMRQYLEDLSNIATDENEIDKLSKACEQPTGSTRMFLFYKVYELHVMLRYYNYCKIKHTKLFHNC